MIEVKNLVKKYGEHLAVDDISFKVEKGRIYGLLGPNGAGKSTTMNIMTGCIGATSGQVIIDGHDIYEEPVAAKKKIGYLPESPPLYPDFTPREYLTFVAELKEIQDFRREKRIDEILELTGLSEVQHRLIKNLSKGYKQRVGLAQAIIGYPEVIILDEPTVGLDPVQIIEIRDMIKALGESHTVILSSHILSEVSMICDYVLIISHGKLVASDTPENLSNLMLGTGELRLTARGTELDIWNALKKIDEIKNMTVVKGLDGFDIDVVSEHDVDLREKVFYALAEARCPIISMSSARLSLEEVFIELTQTPAVLETAKERAAAEQEEENDGDL